MVLKFTKDLRVFAPDLNNLAVQLRYGVKNSADCLVTEHAPNNMSVDVAAGTIIFNAADVAVGAANPAISAADPSLDRIDIVVVNSVGTVSVITGTPADPPKAPTYDPSVYLPLARVFVDDGTTTIVNADITDIRIHNTGVGAGVQVEEIDGVPTVPNVNTIKVTNGSLTDLGGGAVQLETGVGGTNIYTETFVGQTSLAINHNLSDDKPIVQVYDSANEQITPDKIDITDANNVAIEFAVATTGFVVVHGGTAELKQGGVGTYLHSQTVAASAWNVTHNLNSDTPVVQVFDSAGDVVEPTSIDITGANTLTVNFGSNQTGKVRVLAGFFSGVVYQNVDLLPETDDTYDIGSGALRWQDLFLSGTMTIDGDILPETDDQSDLGSASKRFQDLFLSGTITVDGDVLPETHNTSDLGTTSVRFKDGYFQGKLYVVGGIDPSYIQLDPQASEPDNTLNNKLWVDSSDSNKLKFKNNAGTNNEVVDFGHVGTGANDIVQLDGSGDLPAVGGGNLTGVASVGIVPVGGIVAWLKDYTNTPSLPAQFMECNGQTVSDGDSPYNGQALPNLNSGSYKMLRGATASGGTGGADTHTLTTAEMPAHTHSYNRAGSWSGCATGGSDRMEPPTDSETTGSAGGGGAHNNLPAYYEVVWVMRIK